jgi:hypothetical protein
MQAEPENGVRFIRVLHQFLDFVQHVAVQEAGEQPIGVQCPGTIETGAGEEIEQRLQRPQRPQRP